MSTDKDQVPTSNELPARYVTPQRVIDRLIGSAEVSAPAMETAAFVIGKARKRKFDRSKPSCRRQALPLLQRAEGRHDELE